MQTFDVAVVGLGSMGSFAAAEMASRGARVVGFDRFTPPHSHGSHSGGTRVYRIAYPEGTGYPALAQQAGLLWDRINSASPKPVLHRSGMLYMGEPGDPFLGSVLKSAQLCNLESSLISAGDIRERYPAFQIPASYAGWLDSNAGWIDVDLAIRYALNSARQAGATLHLNAEVTSWRTVGSSEVEVTTAEGAIRAGKLAIACGAWSMEVLQDIHLPLKLRRKVLAWFNPLEPSLFNEGRIPVFTFPEKAIYGFPAYGEWGVKLAEHLEGEEVSTPAENRPQVDKREIQSLCETAYRYMPGLAGPWPAAGTRLLRAVTCLYTMTPDENFIVDFHPFHSHIVFAAGFSGHGFKFAPLMGKALADLSLNGETSIKIDFLRLARFSSSYLR